MIKYRCPKCGVALESPPTLAGKEDQCPVCKHACLVPSRRRGPFLSFMAKSPVWLWGAGGILLAAGVVVVLVWLSRPPQPHKNPPSPESEVRVPTVGEERAVRLEGNERLQVWTPDEVRESPVFRRTEAGTQEAPAPTTPREIAARVSPSVVLLVTQDVNGQPLAMASGFVVREGVIATNLHVIERAASAYAKPVVQETVTAERFHPPTTFRPSTSGEPMRAVLLKSRFDVQGVVASDPTRDLVLLAVDGLKAAPLTIGDSTQVAVGDPVYALGNPRGLEGTFSSGIISSVRKIGDDSLLQITAPISPGSSGGPVVNGRGEVVGVAVGMFKDGQNLNFAIPSQYLSALLPVIKTPLALPEATKAATGQAEKSILGEMGRRSAEGVEGVMFSWGYSGDFYFSIKNKLGHPVKNVHCLVVFYTPDGEHIDFEVVTLSETVPAGLAKRVRGEAKHDVERMNREFGQTAVRWGRVEIRVLYFDILNLE